MRSHVGVSPGEFTLMVARIRFGFRGTMIAALALLAALLLPARAEDTKPEKLAEPINKGQRVFSIGHSFHVWVPGIVTDLCKKAEIGGHKQISISSIGGSRVIQHWNKTDDNYSITAKDILKTGKVDVLTLSPIFLPDPGIENFTNS